ncbi:MAG: AAA-like domain-containing protein [Rivularia sp. (in: Bacteria)]|nr:AAA-like domain-containing protein [Rivularia sp. MS3]
MVKKILLLSASPTNTAKLRLDKEVQEIKASFKSSKYREEFEIISHLAVTTDDLRRALLDYDPQIVHFSGHGMGKQGLALEDSSGKMKLVSTDALVELFKLFPNLECVLMNACYSEVQAEAIHQYIDYVIGMKQEIGDKAARKFAEGFYDALGAGRTIEDGFKFGCVAINLEDIPESSTPVFKSRKVKPENPQGKRIFVSYKRNVEPDEKVALQIVDALSPENQVFIDQKILVGTTWAELIEAEIRQSDFLIVLLSEYSAHSEMVETEIRMAYDFAQVNAGKPVILPIRLAYRQQFHYPLSAYLNHINWAYWENDDDTPELINELKQAISNSEVNFKPRKTVDLLPPDEIADLSHPSPCAQPENLEIPEGTMNPKSAFYVERKADGIALNTISRQGVTISIKGPRQVGKSSLLNRVIKTARDESKRVIFLDFQLLGKADLENDEIFLRQFCYWLSEELDMEDQVDTYWQKKISNIQRCTRYMSRYILKELGSPLVLAMDEVDKVFDAPFRNDFFGMLRNWHNSRAMSDIWNNLDFVLVTSTEPYQLIDDLNQSPFNVGQVIELEDFSLEQVTDLNSRHCSPFHENGEVQKLMELLNGHPYLTRKALYLVASQQITATELFNHAGSSKCAFGDHLRRLLSLLHDRQELKQALLEVVQDNTCEDQKRFWQLRGAGLIRSSGKQVIPRCQLYAEYFREHLHE